MANNSRHLPDGLSHLNSIYKNGNVSTKPHAVMVPCPLQGHINPMLQFAKALTIHHNFNVTFVNNQHTQKVIEESRSSTMPPIEEDDSLRFVWVDNGLPPDFDYGDLNPRWLEFRQGCVNMKAPLKELVESLNQKSPSVTCIVFGSFFPWAHYVAVELNIPSVFFWTQSAAVFSIYYHAPMLTANGFFPYKEAPACKGHESGADLVSYIPGIPPLHPASFPTFLHVEDTNHDLFKLMEEQFATLKNCNTVIINSFKELEEEAFHALQAEPFSVLPVGPLLPSHFLQGNEIKEDSASLLQEKSDCIRWLDEQKKQSVLYISFGTTFHPSVEGVQCIALAIKAIKQPFLWVLRAKSSLQVVSQILSEGFLKDTQDYGLIIPWAPQLQVLSHPSLGGFLTHCGWNSTLESISMGVPLIPCPVISDQTTNYTYVVDIWKVGLGIKRHDGGGEVVDSKEVEAVVRTVLHEEEGKEIRRRVGKLRESAMRASQADGSSNVHMHEFAQAMIMAMRN